MAPKVTISEVTGKPKIIRSHSGREEAKAAAVMTKEEWNTYQTEKFAKQWPLPSYMHEKRELKHVRDGGEGAYRDRTYEIVTRWTEKTQIRYRPHAKSPGSKSHIRYENYAKATTIGQALKMGTFPMDWCYDYEHGFIKVVGGAVRDEPIDPTRVDDEKKLTEVDKVIMNWYRRELAKKYGLKAQDLLTEKGGESMVMRAHRLVANRTAEGFLAAANKEKRLIREEEVLETLSFWGFARNVNRVNVLPTGKEWVWSDTLGIIRDRIGDIHCTKPTVRYPAVTTILNQWLRDHLPPEAASFKWTSLNLNCNYAAKRHRDGNNFGPSMIKAFGDFKHGELCYFPRDDRTVDIAKLPESDKTTLDIKKNLCMFNGNSAHEVNDFEGSRYSVVWFTVGCHAKAPDHCKAACAEMNMPFPAVDENPHSLLAAPAGYAKGVASRPVARPTLSQSRAKESGTQKSATGASMKVWPVTILTKNGKWSGGTKAVGKIPVKMDGKLKKKTASK